MIAFPFPPRPRVGAALVAAAALLAASTAIAQMVPVQDRRQTYSFAQSASVTDGPWTHTPAAPFAYWNDTNDAFAQSDGSTEATSWQISQLQPSFYDAHGGATAQIGNILIPGSYQTYSEGYVVFRLDQTVSYTLNARLDNFGPETGGNIELSAWDKGLWYLDRSTAGHDSLTGRLSPGTYYIGGRSHVSTNLEYTAGPTYSLLFLVQPCIPYIARSPGDTLLACGPNLMLSVVLSGAGAGSTLQWRRNFTPLANGAHYSGATSTSLTILSPCDPDTGWYDVVVTKGGVSEPSSIAHVTKKLTLDVEPGLSAPPSMFALGLAAPNPSAFATTFRYATREPVVLSADVYDAGGRRVATLGTRTVAGIGTLAWDGRDAGGSRVRSGVYFLRVRAAGSEVERRFVRLE